MAELALLRLGARAFHVVLPTPAQRAPVPVRSTGASDAVQGSAPVIAALAASGLIVDLTVAEKIGMYTGLYYLFSTLSAIVGPISNGVAIELFDNYNIIMALAPIFFFIALLLMLFVRRGEAPAGRPEQLPVGREASP